MALLKPELIYNGTTVSFHHIDRVRVDLVTGAAQAVLHSWPTQAARQPGIRPSLVRTYNFAPVSSDYLADAYAAIKALPYWADAEDV